MPLSSCLMYGGGRRALFFLYLLFLTKVPVEALLVTRHIPCQTQLQPCLTFPDPTPYVQAASSCPSQDTRPWLHCMHCLLEPSDAEVTESHRMFGVGITQNVWGWNHTECLVLESHRMFGPGITQNVWSWNHTECLVLVSCLPCLTESNADFKCFNHSRLLCLHLPTHSTLIG